MTSTQQKAHLDNHAKQLNPNSSLYHPKHDQSDSTKMEYQSKQLSPTNENFQRMHEAPGFQRLEATIRLRAEQLGPINPVYRAPKK
jgi:hypothetical protein